MTETIIQIKLNDCKCGRPLKLGEEWARFRVKTAFSYCPARRWFNFWKHNKNVTHAWMPFPSVNKKSLVKLWAVESNGWFHVFGLIWKWKPEVEKQLRKEPKT